MGKSTERLAGLRAMRYEQQENGMKIDEFEQKRAQLLRNWEMIQGKREKIKQDEKIFENAKRTQRRIMTLFGIVFLPIILPILYILAGRGISEGSMLHVILGIMLLVVWTMMLFFNIAVVLWANTWNAKTEANIGSKKAAIQEDATRVKSDIITLLTTPGTIQERMINALLSPEETEKLLALPSGTKDESIVEGKMVSRV